ncbi:hypothetical protein SprV_0401704800 [Sparganum proliferum]
MVQLRFIGFDRQGQRVLRVISAHRNRCMQVLAIFGSLYLAYGFVSHMQGTSKARYLDNYTINASNAVTETTLYRACTDDSLELCRLLSDTSSAVIDADLRSCRSERELFTAAANTIQGDKCLSFEDLGTLPQGEWSRVRIPDAYRDYPMDVDLRTVVLAYTYELEINVVSQFLALF